MAEKYYSWSPYAYVMNNPLKYIDPTGKRLEEPVVLFSSSSSNNLKNAHKAYISPRGDGKFTIFVHGDPRGISDQRGTESIRLTTPEAINKVMSENNPEWKAAMEEGKEITLTMYSCNTGSEGEFLRGSGIDKNGTDNPIAKQITKKYPNVKINAPDGLNYFRNSKNLGVQNQHGDGGYVTFQKGENIGKEVKAYNPPLKKEPTLTDRFKGFVKKIIE